MADLFEKLKTEEPINAFVYPPKSKLGSYLTSGDDVHHTSNSVSPNGEKEENDVNNAIKEYENEEAHIRSPLKVLTKAEKKYINTLSDSACDKQDYDFKRKSEEISDVEEKEEDKINSGNSLPKHASKRSVVDEKDAEEIIQTDEPEKKKFQTKRCLVRLKRISFDTENSKYVANKKNESILTKSTKRERKQKPKVEKKSPNDLKNDKKTKQGGVKIRLSGIIKKRSLNKSFVNEKIAKKDKENKTNSYINKEKLIKQFGTRPFRAVVRLKRCTLLPKSTVNEVASENFAEINSVDSLCSTPVQKTKKNLSVSFVDEVEVMGHDNQSAEKNVFKENDIEMDDISSTDLDEYLPKEKNVTSNVPDLRETELVSKDKPTESNTVKLPWEKDDETLTKGREKISEELESDIGDEKLTVDSDENDIVDDAHCSNVENLNEKIVTENKLVDIDLNSEHSNDGVIKNDVMMNGVDLLKVDNKPLVLPSPESIKNIQFLDGENEFVPPIAYSPASFKSANSDLEPSTEKVNATTNLSDASQISEYEEDTAVPMFEESNENFIMSEVAATEEVASSLNHEDVTMSVPDDVSGLLGDMEDINDKLSPMEVDKLNATIALIDGI